MNEEFYAFIPGAMGYIYYYRRVDVNYAPRDEEGFVDQQSRENLHAFQPPIGLSPEEYTSMFQAEFLKSRESAREQLRKTKICRFRVHTQIGNRECLDELEALELDSDFQGWENGEFVKEIKKI